MSRILVTGASGFIGRAAIAALVAEGHAVRAAVRRPPQPPLPKGIETIQHGDLAEPLDWRPLVDGIDSIVHLAGIAHAGRTAADLYDRVNRLATAQLAEQAARAGVGRLVFVSSIYAQTGPAADHALTERDPATPAGPYGRSKLAAEDAVRAAGVPFTILRPVALYGPGGKGSVASLLRVAASRLPLPLKELGNRRSLLGIGNFTSALTFVLSSAAAAGQTYVVADPGIPPRLADLIAVLRRAQNHWVLLLPLPPAYVEHTLRLLGWGELWDRFGGNLRVDCAKLIAAGWQPQHDTRAGLAAWVQTAMPAAAAIASESSG